MTQYRIYFLLLTTLLSVFYACKGPEGEIGPQGPRGEQGPQGDQGPAGADGQDGNANIIASDWFTPTEYILSNDGGFSPIDYLNHDESAPEIAQDIIDSGVILVYGRLNGYSPSVWPLDHVSLLPISLTYNSGGVTQTDTWLAIISVQNVKIRFINNNNRYSSLSPNHSFRYVIIPPTIAGNGRIAHLSKESLTKELAEAGVNISNVEQVIDYFN